MNFLNRIIPALASVLIFIFLEQLLKTPKQIYALAFLPLVVVIWSIWQLTGRKLRTEKFWQQAITVTLFLSSGLIFLSFLEGRFLKQFFLIGLIILIWIFLKVVFLRFHFRSKYQAHSLENISTHLDLVTVFLVASGFFSLIIFLAVSLWILVIIFAIIVILLIYQLIWTGETNLAASWRYIIVIALATTEIFWAVSFLPTSVYVNGLVVAISYYLMTGLARNWLLGIKEGKVIRRYLVISAIALVVVLVTAKWF